MALPKRKRENEVERKFGMRVRELRRAKNLGQRALAKMVGVSFTYLSRIENENLDFGPYPSEDLICRLADALDADQDELLVLAKKVPEKIRRRVFERLDAFTKLADLDDEGLDRVMAVVDAPAGKRRKAK
jgi:HTH-type transcriptional regulator, competence development regulator